MIKQTFTIEGITNESNKETLITGLENINGIKTVDVSLKDGIMNVEYDANQVKLNDIQETVVGMGYEVNTFDVTKDKVKNVSYEGRF